MKKLIIFLVVLAILGGAGGFVVVRYGWPLTPPIDVSIRESRISSASNAIDGFLNTVGLKEGEGASSKYVLCLQNTSDKTLHLRISRPEKAQFAYLCDVEPYESVEVGKWQSGENYAIGDVVEISAIGYMFHATAEIQAP